MKLQQVLTKGGEAFLLTYLVALIVPGASIVLDMYCHMQRSDNVRTPDLPLVMEMYSFQIVERTQGRETINLILSLFVLS
jgi:hypothetical protein